jgi:aspartyl protease family protein
MRLITFAAVLSMFACAATAADIGVAGLFPNKAVLVIDGGPPKTYSVGSTVADGVKLIASDGSTATLEVHGKRETIAIGGYVSRAVGHSRASVTLEPDSGGHYLVQGQINGGAVRMLLDTGATAISLPASDAARLGINYRKGKIDYVTTANGTMPVYRIALDTVKVGDIEMHQVDAVVQESGLPFILLGMSFLNRTDMRRDGEQMVLTKRY